MKKYLLISILFLLAVISSAQIMTIQTNSGSFSFSLEDIQNIEFVGMNSVEDIQLISQINFELKQNYPNPFGKSSRSNSTKIAFNLKSLGLAELVIYNIKGQKVKSLLKSQLEAGDHFINWNGQDSSGNAVASGVYFYKLNFAGATISKKMIFLK